MLSVERSLTVIFRLFFENALKEIYLFFVLVVEKLGPELSRLEVSHTDQITKLNDITEQVSQFMERYNGTVKKSMKV